MTTEHSDTRQRRLGGLFEPKDGPDFPYYDGKPVEIAGWKWIVMLAAAIAGFLVLTLVQSDSQVVVLILRVAFLAIPLVAFIVLAGPSWTAVIRRPRGKDFGAIFLFFAIDMVVSGLIAVVIRGLDPGHMTANRATDGLASASDIIFFYIGTFIQILGEEVFSLIPFLAVLYLAYTKLHLSRTAAIIISWLVTAIWFGAAHLETYDWNLLQCFVVIGLARIVLTLAYIRTKNLIVPFGSHLLVDWGIFTFTTIAVATGAA
jgi:membrane protease YdiL (CAAX protease family)